MKPASTRQATPATRQARSPRPLLRPRLYLGGDLSLGPGKIDLLRKVGECGSISAAARALGIPYKRAWLLIDSINQGVATPVLDTAVGGKKGGGARLTALGVALIAAYDALEAKLNAAARVELGALQRLVAPAARRRSSARDDEQVRGR